MDIFGIEVHNLTLIDVLKKIEDFIEIKTPHYIVTLNTYILALAKRNNNYKEIINNADVVIPDGMGIIFLAKFLKLPIRERVSGIDLIDEICKIAVSKNYNIFLLGAKLEVIEKTKDVLKGKYPELKIVGFHDGYFSDGENEDIIENIKLKNPDILLVALGAPKQEIWIKENLHKLNIPVCIGIGGSFDVISGRLKRAPKWIQRAGFEWLFRLIQEPKRIRRILSIFYFLILILCAKIKLGERK